MKNVEVQRTNGGYLASHERAILETIARFLPQVFTPDRLTAFGVFGAFVTLVGFTLAQFSLQWIWLANFGLFMNWLGDSLDGTVARIRQIERPNYGYYLDQTIDTLSNLMIALGAGLSPFFRLDVALLALAAYHMLSIHAFVRSVLTREQTLDVAGFGPTEMRLGIIVVNFIILYLGTEENAFLGLTYTWCDVVALLTVVVMLVFFAMEVRKEAAVQLALDRGRNSSKSNRDTA